MALRVKVSYDTWSVLTDDNRCPLVGSGDGSTSSTEYLLPVLALRVKVSYDTLAVIGIENEP